MEERPISPIDIGWLHNYMYRCQNSLNYILKMGEFDWKQVRFQ